MKKNKSKLQLNNEMAELIIQNWPEFKSQQYFADKLKVSQAQISRSFKKWDRHYPIRIEAADERDNVLEENLKKTYNLKQAIVLKSKDTHLNSYSEQIGMHSSELLSNAIPEIIEKRERNQGSGLKRINNGPANATLRIAGSDGNNVISCISCLINDLAHTNLQIEVMPTIALRCRNLVELSPAHSMAPLLNLLPNVTVTNMYHLPEIEINDYEQMEHLVKQRIVTVHRLKFNYHICKSDIVVLGVENVIRNFFGKGFPAFVGDMGLSDIIRKLNILGEVSFSPFNTKYGFLFHYLRNTVFAPKDQSDDMEGSIENWEFKHSKDEQVDLVKEIAENAKSIGLKDLFDVARLYCSIFTQNICSFEQFMQKDADLDNKPFILITACGSSHKAEPLQYVLKRLKQSNGNVIDGLVTSRIIAEKVLSMENKKSKTKK